MELIETYIIGSLVGAFMGLLLWVIFGKTLKTSVPKINCIKMVFVGMALPLFMLISTLMFLLLQHMI